MTKVRIRPSRRLRLLPLLALAAAAPHSPWSDAAVRDLTAIHDLVRDNHPGLVDPGNPGFRDWLDGGRDALLSQARAATSLHDYQLVLRDYANGFADGHLNLVMTESPAHLWPGFLVRTDVPGAPVRVSVTATGPDAPTGVRPGLVVESCGGTPARTLLEERVLRPLLNPHVPQRLRLFSALLMVADAPSDRWPVCTMSWHGRSRIVPLRWRPITPAALAREQARSSGIELPATGLRRIGDVWLVSLPSFAPRDAAATARLHVLVARLRAQAATLHAARHVVLDLRGNDGGNSEWGVEVAEALWGKAAVEAVQATMPATVDWRVSARNAAALRKDSAMMRRQGQTAFVGYLDALAGRMDAALEEHQVFLREEGDPPAPLPQLAAPFSNPVHVLTTPHCASACLDFVDLVDKLPGTVRVGLETSSDTDYLELASAVLPSGHAMLRYAMKVYRQRERAANASYKPAIAWPGGTMTDASIAGWIDTLR